MTRHLLLTCLMALSAVSLTRAQTPAANPVSEAVREGWTGAKNNVTRAARAMPDDKFAFRPVASVRTFGEIVAHIAGANYIFCSTARGEKAPFAEDHFEKTVKSKAEVIKALDAANAYCDAAYATLTDGTAGEMIAAPFGSGKTARAAALMGNTGHLQEHYGNLVTYLRINGIVPPSSAGQ